MKKTILIISILLIILVSCTNNISTYEKIYISQAKTIAEKYGLDDAETNLVFNSMYDGYRRYDFILESDKFESLSKLEKYSVLVEIKSNYVPLSEFLVLEKVNSKGNLYDIDAINENMLLINDEEFFNFALEDKNSVAFKVEVYRFIEGRYKYYDTKEGRYCGDKYTEVIFQEAAEKYGISTSYIDSFWGNPEIAKLSRE